MANQDLWKDRRRANEIPDSASGNAGIDKKETGNAYMIGTIEVEGKPYILIHDPNIKYKYPY